MKAETKKEFKPMLYIAFIYLLIFLQYPLSAAISEQIFNSPLPSNLKANISIEQLLIWGGIRLFAVLPLIVTVLIGTERTKSVFLQLGNKKRMISFTFWSTITFVILGIFLYPNFLSPTNLSWTNFLYFLPYFSIYAISNAFVEEVFFRGLLLSYFNEKSNFALANFLQAFLFATIHFTGVALTGKLVLFIALTFVLGIIWGWITKKTKSLVPAIILHMLADLFVAISLF